MTTNSKETVSLYLHFPFCVKKCAYCAFFSEPCRDEDLKDAYAGALIRRIRSMPGFDVKTVYFGGGTPTVMGPKRLCGILDALTGRCRVSRDAEITVEANPGTVDGDGLASLAACGFNRLSLGMQSANDKTLALLGRIHTNGDFLRCFESAAKHFDNVSADMIFAVPGDDPAATLEQIRLTAPKHVSAYSLMVEEGTPLYARRSEYVFPDEESEEAQYDTICRALRDEGYTHYEISSFAIPGYESRHNTVYWERGEYVGLGPGAYSFYKGRRFSVKKDTKKFIEDSYLPFLHDTDFGSASPVTPEEAEEERIMLGLRLKKGVRLAGKRLKAAENAAGYGYGEIKNGVFALNEKGFRVSNAVIAQILAERE